MLGNFISIMRCCQGFMVNIIFWSIAEAFTITRMSSTKCWYQHQ